MFGGLTMTQLVSRNAVQAFYRAYASRDPAAIVALVHDDAQWMITGPVALLPFCGLHRGREEIFDLFRNKIPSVFEFKGFDPEDMLIDGDRVAVFGRLSGIQRSTGRMISYRCAQFIHFVEDKVASARFLLDSFDAAEQMLGRPIDLLARDCERQTARSDDLVAV